MSKKIRNKSSRGATSSILLVLGIAIVVLVLVLFVIVRINASKKTADAKKPSTTTVEGPVKPVYETTIADVRFKVESTEDLGNVLISPQGYQYNLNSTERFIRVTIGGQNKGKVNLPTYSWEVGSIIDEDGRVFVSIDNDAYYFLPRPNLCGALLKPEFDLIPCVRYYEVSKASDKLKIQVSATPIDGKSQKAILDLDITQ